MLRYVVLGLLHRGPRHGYALMKEYRERVGVQVNTGSFYRDLPRLVATGLVRTADRSADGDPRRTPYQITDAGRDAFRRWFTDLALLGGNQSHDDELSARIAFLPDVDPDDARAVLDQLQDDLWARAKSLERARAGALAATTSDASKGLPVLALMLARRLRRVSSELAFLDDLRVSYEDWLGRAGRSDPPAAARSTAAAPTADGARESGRAAPAAARAKAR
jgi:DNA-binding PadR family transcriptional regulator